MSRHVSEGLVAYLHGELSAPELAAVEEHLTSCASCTRELEALRQAHQGLQSLPAEDAPPELWSKIEAALEAPARKPERWRFWDRRYRLLVAGLAVGAVVG